MLSTETIQCCPLDKSSCKALRHRHHFLAFKTELGEALPLGNLLPSIAKRNSCAKSGKP